MRVNQTDANAFYSQIVQGQGQAQAQAAPAAEELTPWTQRIRKVAASTAKTFVITNNHYLGKAVVNALELISMLRATKVQVPDPLRLRYPELEAIAASPPQSPTLFPLGSPE